MLKLSFNYPTSVNRNIDEIVRCVSTLQMCAKSPAATYVIYVYTGSDSIQLGAVFIRLCLCPFL